MCVCGIFFSFFVIFHMNRNNVFFFDYLIECLLSRAGCFLLFFSVFVLIVSFCLIIIYIYVWHFKH